MAFKQFQLDELGMITVYKRRGSRSIRLSIRPDGSLRVTIPTWTPYATGVSFARSRAEWIRRHQPVATSLLSDGQLIGKAHRLRFIASSAATRVSTRLQGTEITINHPLAVASVHTSVQKAATTASLRALKLQADKLLPQRLAELAQKHGFTYKSVSVRQLKSRWGSCDQSRNIVLNIFLMQLPWHLIDYVLLHELTHTRVMQHGPKFWEAMTGVEPNTISLRKQIRSYQPTLQKADIASIK